MHSLALEVSRKHSPDLNKLKAIKLDARTTIYIDPEKNPDITIENWQDKLDECRGKDHRNAGRKRNSEREAGEYRLKLMQLAGNADD